MIINIIAAISHENFGIGYQGDLIYKIREDLKLFKELTMGHPIVMGRKTWESLPRELPGRRNIVITSNPGLPCPESYDSLDKALDALKNEEEVWIIGGGQLYAEAIDKADFLYLTEIFDTPPADTFFPKDYMSKFFCVHRDYHYSDDLRYEFTKYERV